MGKNTKDQKPAPVDELDAALGLSEEDVTEQISEDEETEEEVQASVVQEPAPTASVPAPQVPTETKKYGEDEVVTDENGVALFIRNAPTILHEPMAKVRNQPATKPSEKRVTRAPGANPALLDFPTDRWGITKDIKTAITRAASRIAGDEGKKALVDEVLRILVLHLNAKYKQDHAYREGLKSKHGLDAE